MSELKFKEFNDPNDMCSFVNSQNITVQNIISNMNIYQYKYILFYYEKKENSNDWTNKRAVREMGNRKR